MKKSNPHWRTSNQLFLLHAFGIVLVSLPSFRLYSKIRLIPLKLLNTGMAGMWQAASKPGGCRLIIQRFRAGQGMPCLIIPDFSTQLYPF